MRSRQQGFTLIEAAVAIAVVAILSGIIVPLVVKNLNDSRVARAKNDIQVIAAAIASQLKDTGRRPTAAGGPGGATGAAGAVWQAGPASAVNFPTNTAPTANANTFTNLFTNAGTVATTQTLFFGGGSGITVGSEFGYKGPYLGTDVALKMDPWNRRYLVLGYNANGQTGNTPIYVVCAGPDGVILPANWNGGTGPAAGVWDVTTVNAAGDSRDDLWVRVN
jgi:prepilin-type N-terminal cleavage/methylation domain-containing protein